MRLVTHSELAKHHANSSGALWLSICGEVFDVSRGRQHYGPGSGYGFFTGRDGTRAFVTGHFNETGAPASQAGGCSTLRFAPFRSVSLADASQA